MLNREAFRVKKLAAVLVAVMTVFCFTTSMLPISASAASDKKMKIPAATEKKNTFAKAYVFRAQGKTSYGYDWTYNLYSKSIKVSCKYSFKKHEYRFRVTGKEYGLSKLELKYKTDDNKWVTVPMRVFVDTENNIMRSTVKLNRL